MLSIVAGGCLWRRELDEVFLLSALSSLSCFVPGLMYFLLKNVEKNANNLVQREK